MELGRLMPDDCVMFGAHNESGDLVAGALNLIGSDCLYGRYWGALQPHKYKCLHFELCYYQVSGATQVWLVGIPARLGFVGRGWGLGVGSLEGLCRVRGFGCTSVGVKV